MSEKAFDRLLMWLGAICLLMLLLMALFPEAQAQTYAISPVARQQFFDANGAPLASGFIQTYAAGTTTPQATYSDNSGTLNANPIQLDAGGYATIFLSANSYKFVVMDANHITQYTVDGISGANYPLMTLFSFSSASAPSCSSGNYKIWADSTNNVLEMCNNGTVTNILGSTGSAKNLNNIRFADQYASLSAVQTDIGSTNPAHVIIPTGYSGTDCPAVQNNDVFEDYRAGGRSGSGTSSFICTQNIVQYNTKTPGLTDALIRPEMTRTAVDTSGSILALYPITHLLNATVSGGASTVDGASTQADIDGTLSGTLSNAQGNESLVQVSSTGGTLSNARGVIGSVNNTNTSTTAITNAIGISGRGCTGMIAGTAPTNCYGGYFTKQSEASTRNYSIALESTGLLMYDSGGVKGGLDCENASHTIFPCFRTDSASGLTIRAMDATAGVTIADSTGAGRYVFNDSLFNITNPLTVSGLTTATGGIKAGASGSTISDTRELVQSAHSCGTTTTCANTANGSYKMIFGSVALSSGTPSTATITGISPAFTNSSSYFCVATNASVQADSVKIVNISGSSFTITGPNTVTDTINYHCIGN